MDATHLKEKYPELISHLEKNGYSKGYIKKAETVIRKVISLDGDDSVKSYEDLFNSMNPSTGYSMSHSAQKTRRNLIGLVMAFDIHGILPDGRSKTGFMRENSFSHLNNHYRLLIENFRQYATKHGKRSGTIRHEIYLASCFFLHLQNRGAGTISEATCSQVVDFFLNDNGTRLGHTYRRKIKSVLIGNRGTEFENACADVIELLPFTRAERKNFPYLREEEAETLRRAIVRDDTGHSVRDRLVFALAFLYGMRGTDIVRFSYDRIDWENDTITFEQSKTGAIQTLPLLPIIGNFVVDLVRDNPDRKGDVPMFTNMSCPGAPLSESSVSQIVSTFIKSSNVRADGGLKGLRLLRHHAATTMLRSGVKSPVISSVLGHFSPESIVPYIDGALEDLRSCGLDISQYPVPEDLFKL